MNPYNELRRRRIPPIVLVILLCIVLAAVLSYGVRNAVVGLALLVVIALVVLVTERARRGAERRNRSQSLRLAISGGNELRLGLSWYGYDVAQLPMRLGATIGADGLELWRGSRDRPLVQVPLAEIVGVAPGFGTIWGYAAPQIVVVTRPSAERVAAFNADDDPDSSEGPDADHTDDEDDELPESEFGDGTIALPLPLWDAAMLFPASNARAWKLLQQVGERIPIMAAAPR